MSSRTSPRLLLTIRRYGREPLRPDPLIPGDERATDRPAHFGQSAAVSLREASVSGHRSRRVRSSTSTSSTDLSVNRDLVEEREFDRIRSFKHGPMPPRKFVQTDRDSAWWEGGVAMLDSSLENFDTEIEEVQVCASVQMARRGELFRSLGSRPEPVLQDHIDAVGQQFQRMPVQHALQSIVKLFNSVGHS